MDETLQDWASYLCRFEGVLASIRLDLAFGKEDLRLDLPYLFRVKVHFNNPREDGLSSQEEFPLLSEIEEVLIESIQWSSQAVFVGCITMTGTREFVFYAPSEAHLVDAVKKVFLAFPDYKFQLAHRMDSSWIHYEQALWPDEIQMQILGNGRVLDALMENGVDPLLPHVIDHTILFRSVETRVQFRRLLPSEYSVVKEGNDYSAERPYMINVVRTQTLDRSGIDATVIELFALAKQCDGEYDGWGTVAETGK